MTISPVAEPGGDVATSMKETKEDNLQDPSDAKLGNVSVEPEPQEMEIASDPKDAPSSAAREMEEEPDDASPIIPAAPTGSRCQTPLNLLQIDSPSRLGGQPEAKESLVIW